MNQLREAIRRAITTPRDAAKRRRLYDRHNARCAELGLLDRGRATTGQGCAYRGGWPA